ncbi:unnamed protein product [Brassica oleracea var. botrytis]|uniref:Alpha 1,4-glycosyltransferase domain-containing protein n=1 Tax=Brassica oleracea TaxID=3712 RepID=A0A3P6C3U1_BRAOL|nr:unnamed protein product [Brassica oleracea]
MHRTQTAEDQIQNHTNFPPNKRDTILKPLCDLGYKVFAATQDLSLLLENTQAKTWFQEMKSCKRDPGRIPLSQNLSNLARLAIIYKSANSGGRRFKELDKAEQCGSYLVTRVVQRAQETMIGNSFTVLPPVAFHPFNWKDIQRLFRTPRSSDETQHYSKLI